MRYLDGVKYRIYRDVLDMLYYAQALDRRYPNAYGRGRTPEMAVMSLTMAIRFYSVTNPKRDGQDEPVLQTD